MKTFEPESTFRILVASDIHLGYKENDAIRGNDSFETFKEILSIAKEENVDLILHGGDLFHDDKPSRKTLHTCLALLREYNMGDKEIQFKYLDDQSADNQHCKFKSDNLENPYLNISIPMFSIHGNHDDPTGPGNLCSLDLLHTAGLVNYFGKSSSLEKILISPLQFKKGDTRLSLFGLGYIGDATLNKIFQSKDVTMLQPREDQGDWFNIFVLHQNRTQHTTTTTRYIPEQFLAKFLDLVIWGHEHECKLNVNNSHVERTASNIDICQPGSSIATSLRKSEAVPKYVGLLEIYKKEYRIKPIRLNTVRQLYIQDVVLSKDMKGTAEEFCKEKVEDLIKKARTERTGSNEQPLEPLIRLRVDYTGFTPFITQRFGNQFNNRVANPMDIILFKHQKQNQDKKDFVLLDSVDPMVLDSTTIEEMVRIHFTNIERDGQLELLSEIGMAKAMKKSVREKDKTAISICIQDEVSEMQGYLKSRKTGENDIDGNILLIKEERRENAKEKDEIISQTVSSQLGSNRSFTDGDDGPMPNTSSFLGTQGQGDASSSTSTRNSEVIESNYEDMDSDSSQGLNWGSKRRIDNVIDSNDDDEITNEPLKKSQK